MDKNPDTTKHQVLLRSSRTKPFEQKSSHSRNSFNHFRVSNEGYEKRHSNTLQIRTLNLMPGYCMGKDSTMNMVIPKNHNIHSSEHVHGSKRKHSSNQRYPIAKADSTCSSSNWKRHIRFPSYQNRSSFSQEQGSNGHVFFGYTGLHYNAVRKMVKQRLPKIHQETNKRIQQRSQQKKVNKRKILHDSIIK